MNTFEWTPELRFLVALALGFLVGLERESTKIEEQKMVFGGVRTHPIISLLGSAAHGSTKLAQCLCCRSACCPLPR